MRYIQEITSFCKLVIPIIKFTWRKIIFFYGANSSFSLCADRFFSTFYSIAFTEAAQLLLLCKVDVLMDKYGININH